MSFETRYGGYGKWWWYTPRHRWFSYNPHGPHEMPEKPACYVFLLDGVAVYVGQTSNLQSRMRQHRVRATGDNTWKTNWGALAGDLQLKVKFGQRYGDWCMREARLIHRLQPRFNRRLV